MSYELRGIAIWTDSGAYIHTGHDLGLVQEAKKIGSPGIQSVQISIPGRNGLLNLTSGLTGRPAYNNRELSFQYFLDGSRADRQAILDRIYTVHGTTAKIIDDDRLNMFYRGELSISHEDHGSYTTIFLDVDAYPFATELGGSGCNIALSSSKPSGTINIENNGVPVSFEAHVTGSSVTVSLNGGATRTISPGTYKFSDWILNTGSNSISVSGTNGTFNIFYQKEMI